MSKESLISPPKEPNIPPVSPYSLKELGQEVVQRTPLIPLFMGMSCAWYVRGGNVQNIKESLKHAAIGFAVYNFAMGWGNKCYDYIRFMSQKQLTQQNPNKNDHTPYTYSERYFEITDGITRKVVPYEKVICNVMQLLEIEDNAIKQELLNPIKDISKNIKAFIETKIENNRSASFYAKDRFSETFYSEVAKYILQQYPDIKIPQDSWISRLSAVNSNLEKSL